MSDKDVVVPLVLHRDCVANLQLELYIGTDNVLRVNVDGVCALRVKIVDRCKLVVSNDRRVRGDVEQTSG